MPRRRRPLLPSTSAPAVAVAVIAAAVPGQIEWTQELRRPEVGERRSGGNDLGTGFLIPLQIEFTG